MADFAARKPGRTADLHTGTGEAQVGCQPSTHAIVKDRQMTGLACHPLEYLGPLTLAARACRSSVGADLEEGIAATQVVAEWAPDGGAAPTPVMLLRHQQAVCRALQRLQSRLMHCLQVGARCRFGASLPSPE